MYNKVYSEFEIKDSSIGFDGDTTLTKIGCVGSLEETLDSKTVKKKCEGIENTVCVKGTGTGEVKLTLHIKYDLYAKMYGMKFDSLVTGVQGYGKNSIHKPFRFVGKVLDEEGVEKLKAYPNLILKEGISRKITNGEEEVAEIELTASVNPDEEGFGMYETVTDDLDATTKTTFVNNWMTNFTSDMVQASS